MKRDEGEEERKDVEEKAVGRKRCKRNKWRRKGRSKREETQRKRQKGNRKGRGSGGALERRRCKRNRSKK